MAAEVIIEDQPKKGQDRLDVKDPDGHSAREYLAVLESYGGDFRKVFSKRLQEQIDNYLLKFGDPKQYGEFVHFADTLWESMLTWAVVNEWAKLRKRALVTEKEKEELEKAKEEYKKRNNGAEPPRNVNPAGYL